MTFARLFLLPLALLFTQCRYTSSPDEPVIQGPVYSGEMRVVNIHGIQQDTFISQVELSLGDHQFLVALSDGTTTGCTGVILQDSIAQKIDFQSNSCACWCDCAPNIDCGGDPILGKFSYQKVDDSLFLQKNVSWGIGAGYDATMHLIRQ